MMISRNELPDLCSKFTVKELVFKVVQQLDEL
jgi:hypothetical protein